MYGQELAYDHLLLNFIQTCIIVFGLRLHSHLQFLVVPTKTCPSQQILRT